MATFSDEQKAFIREIVFEAFPVIIERHVQECIWGRKLTRAFWLTLGIAIGAGVPGIAAAAKLFF